MRYTTQAFGEQPVAVGEFNTGATVTLVLYDLSTLLSVGISSAVCTEIGVTGIFTWSSSNISSAPTAFTEYAYVMTDTTTGRTHKGKIVVGGFPSESAVRRYDGEIHINSTLGVPLTTPGTFEFPIGTHDTPVSNLVDARTIADFLNFNSYHIFGGTTITLITNHDDWEFRGTDPDADIVDHGVGNSVMGASYERCGIRGDISGRISAENCIVGLAATTTTGLEGIFTDVGLSGTLQPAVGGVINGLRVAARDIFGVTIDYNGVQALIVIGALQGIIIITNMSAVGDLFAASVIGSEITIGASNTSGIVRLGGVGEVLYTGSVQVFIDDLVKGSDTQATADHVVGRALIDITADPWLETIYSRAASPPDTVVLETYELYDQDGVAINGDDTTGNNPLFDATRLLAERRRV